MRNVFKSLTAKTQALAALICVLSILGMAASSAHASAFLKSKAQPVDVLIITGPGGHNLAADNIQKRLTETGHTWARFDFSSLSAWTFEQTLDMLEKTPEQANEFYRNYYAMAKKAKRPGVLPQGEWHSNEQLMSVLNIIRPRLILSTYAIAMETIDRLKMNGKIANLPTGLIPTDYHPERYWTGLLPMAADHVFAPSFDWEKLSVKYGTPAEKITVTGIPGNPKSDVELHDFEVAELWKSLKLDPSIKTIIISGGSGGVGTFGPMLDSISSAFSSRPEMPVQIVFATGSNQKNFEIVQNAKASMPKNVHLEALGFTPSLPQYMNYVADIVVSKAGGLTTTEISRSRGLKNGVMREGRPLLLTVPAYGIEPGNAEYFFKTGMAAPTEIHDLGSNLLKLLDSPQAQAKMMAAQARIREAAAPEKIIEWTEEQLKKSDQVEIALESPEWIKEKIEGAIATKKKAVLTLSNVSDAELIKIADQRTREIAVVKAEASRRASEQRLSELRLKYPKASAQKGARPFRLAWTVDDLPGGTGGYEVGKRRETVEKMRDVFLAHGIVPYGFVNSRNVQGWTEVEDVLKIWREAGFQLGNHTHSHGGATKMSTSQFIRDVEQTDEFLAELGLSVEERRRFRFPMLEEGNTQAKRAAIQKYFEANGYTNAPVTMDSFDYLSQAAYTAAGADATAKKAAVKAGVATALKHARESILLSDQVLGRQISHIGLLHLAEINADQLHTLLSELEKQGAEFVTLDEALRDPAYRINHGQASRDMGSFLEELLYANGEWSIGKEEVRSSRYKPSTIQKQLVRAAQAPAMCRDLFKAR